MFGSAVLAVFLAFQVIPRIVLRILTKGRIRSRLLPYYEVYDEIAAELKARRIAAEVRREAAQRRDA
jgi:hypothetical protein